MGVLLDQQHFGAGGSRCQSRRQSGNSATDYKHISGEVKVFVAIRIAVTRWFPQAGGFANEWLVHVLPEGTRPEEHLVVEARWQEPR